VKSKGINMQHIFIEREFEPTLTTEGFADMAEAAFPCMPLYRVEWVESLLSADGKYLTCHFIAPDAEAVRSVVRSSTNKSQRVWAGSFHDMRAGEQANVLVARSFDEAVQIEDIQAQEDAHAGCLETYRVKFVRTFFSSDQKRMLCLYQAPDAESVRRAQTEANMPLDNVRACQYFSAQTMSQ
jgi:hypothetical protein